MGRDSTVGGWRISQVVNLLDMPRRDITRSCYADRNRGGAGILQPTDGSWGRRSYSVEDIAWLYLVKLQHDAGFSLPEIARRMDTSVGVDELRGYLGDAASRASEAIDELLVKRERARVLRCALAEEPGEAIARYLQGRLGDEAFEELRLTVGRAMHPESGDSVVGHTGPHDRTCIKKVLEEPGMDLAIELWAGPGAYERLAGA